MRVRFVLFNAYLGGGTVRTTFLLAGELTRRGHDVEVASVYRHLAEPQIQLPRVCGCARSCPSQLPTGHREGHGRGWPGCSSVCCVGCPAC